MRAGVIATKLAIAVFIIPYMFVLNPAMLLVDASLGQILQFSVTSLVGMFAIAGGLEGFINTKLSTLGAGLGGQRRFADDSPEVFTDLIGVVLIAFLLFDQYIVKK